MTTPEAPQDAPHRLDTVVVEQTPRLRCYLRRFASGPQDREDILQDVWMLYLVHRHRIVDHDRTAAWLRTTASRQALRTRRSARRERVDPDKVEQSLVQDAGPAYETALAEQRAAVRRAVARLPERDRLIAGLMATRPELTYAQLAGQLGVARTSIGKLRNRCLTKLRDLLAEEGVTDASVL